MDKSSARATLHAVELALVGPLLGRFGQARSVEAYSLCGDTHAAAPHSKWADMRSASGRYNMSATLFASPRCSSYWLQRVRARRFRAAALDRAERRDWSRIIFRSKCSLWSARSAVGINMALREFLPAGTDFWIHDVPCRRRSDLKVYDRRTITDGDILVRQPASTPVELIGPVNQSDRFPRKSIRRVTWRGFRDGFRPAKEISTVTAEAAHENEPRLRA